MIPEERDRVERLLLDAAQEPPPPSLKARILGAEGRQDVSWPAIAAAVFFFSAVLWIVYHHGSSISGPGAGAPQDSPAMLIRQLGDSDPQVREKAAAELLKLGERARPALEEAKKSTDVEIHGRAKDLLEELDLRTRRARFESQSGTLGDSGVFWIEKSVFDLVPDRKVLSGGLRTVLVEHPRPTFILVTFAGDRGAETNIVTHYLREESDVPGESTPPQVHHHKKYGEGWRSASSHTHEHSDWWDRMQSPEGAKLFGVWPLLRSASLIFVSVKKGNGLLKGLENALGSTRSDVRAAATHALRDYFRASVVNLAIQMLSDPEPMVRGAARQSLLTIIGTVQETPEKTSAWWSTRTEAQRREIFERQWERTKPTRKDLACCEEEGIRYERIHVPDE